MLVQAVGAADALHRRGVCPCLEHVEDTAADPEDPNAFFMGLLGGNNTSKTESTTEVVQHSGDEQEGSDDDEGQQEL